MNLAHRLHYFLNQVDSILLSGFLGELPTDIWSALFTKWLRKAGATIGEKSYVHHRVKIWTPQNIVLGKRVRVPASSDMAGMGRIFIGNDVLIGANVSFITNHHPIDNRTLSWSKIQQGTQQCIVVEDNVWLMNDVKLVAGKNGLIIGQNSWIGTGAVVTKNVPKNELWGGVPARFIHTINIRE